MNLIYFIACHGGPAVHFVEFSKELQGASYQVEIFATGPALDRLRTAGAVEFNPDKLNLEDPSCQKILAEKIAAFIKPGATIITDVGHSIMEQMQTSIAQASPNTQRLAYYDNPESFVPGGYSQTAAKVMRCADKILFANAKLALEPLYTSPETVVEFPCAQRIGIGYYPIQQAIYLRASRDARHAVRRREFFEKFHLVDVGQKILVYFGGNNDVYFHQAFPAFLQLISQANLDPSQYLILLQQHPGAKEKNSDVMLIKYHPIMISELTSEDAQILADVALYYQTSMGPQFALAGLSTIQVGHNTYPDLLIKGGIAKSCTNTTDFLNALRSIHTSTPLPPEKLLKALGVCTDWALRLQRALQN